MHAIIMLAYFLGSLLSLIRIHSTSCTSSSTSSRPLQSNNVVGFPAFVALADGINCVLHGTVCTPNGADRSFAADISRLARLWRLTVTVGWPIYCRSWRGVSCV